MIGNSIASQSVQPTQPKLIGIEHIHFYVHDAALWRKWFETCLDFKTIKTIRTDIHTEILQHGSIQIRLSAPLRSRSDSNLTGDRVTKFLHAHAEGIAEIAFQVAKPNQTNTNISANQVTNGNNLKNNQTDRIYQSKQLNQVEDLNLNRYPPLQAWGDVIYRFVGIDDINKQDNQDRNCNQSTIAPSQSPSQPLFTGIDHIVLNVPAGKMWTAANWHEQNLDLKVSDRFNIATDRSALRSVVMENGDRSVQIPINEPSTPNSQIQEFLDHNHGAGIQHIALHTDNIFQTVATLKQRGVRFLETTPEILIDVQDRDSGRALLQIFTQPIFKEPTFFFEIIQRHQQAQGFGEGNFQALFEAIEQQQMLRATL
jgi:4-hydroxyphenylpyruvate dioxygenase